MTTAPPAGTRHADDGTRVSPDLVANSDTVQGRWFGHLALAGYLRPQRVRMLAGVLLGLLGSLLGLAQPMAAKRVMDTMGQGQPATGPMVTLSLLVVAGGLLAGLGRYVLNWSAESVVRTARCRLADRLLRLRVPVVERTEPGDLIARVTSDTALLRQSAPQAVSAAVTGILVTVATVVMMGLLDPVLLCVTLAVIALVGVLVAFVPPHIGRATRHTQEAVGLMGAALERVLGAFRTVKASGAEQREAEAAAPGGRARPPHRGARRRLGGGVLDLVGGGHPGLLPGCPGSRRRTRHLRRHRRLHARRLPLLPLRLPLRPRTPDRPSRRRNRPAPDRIGRRRPHQGGGGAGDRGAGRGGEGGGPGRGTGSVVRGRGSDGHEAGPAPRSTRTGVTPRHARTAPAPRHRDVRSSPLRLPAGTSPRPPPGLLRGPRRRPDRAARHGGGPAAPRPGHPRRPPGQQALRGRATALAIARALLRRPRLLLLDEATSQLDAANEAALRATITEAAHRTTVLVVAHRLSTVTTADRIVVMEAGRVRAVGTHTELMKNDALYGELARTQLLNH